MIYMGILGKIKAKAKEEAYERKKLKALEKSAYYGEKKKVTAAKKKKAAKAAIKRGKAKARGDKKNSKSEVGKKFNNWADKKAAEMKKEQKKKGELKLPDEYNYKW